MTKINTFYAVGSFLVAVAFAGAAFSHKTSTTTENSPEYNVSVVNTTTNRNTFSNETTAKVENLNIDFNRTVTLFGEVDESTIGQAIAGITSLNNDDSSKPIFLLIASPGGSVFAGEQLISAMESVKAPVYTVCTSLCASMAAIIHQYGKQRLAYDRSILMFHDASGGLQGEVKKMRSLLTLIERKIERTDRYIADKSHMSYEKFMDMHKYDLWIDAVDAKEAGLVDKIIKIQTPKSGATGPSASAVLQKFHTISNTSAMQLNY